MLGVLLEFVLRDDTCVVNPYFSLHHTSNMTSQIQDILCNDCERKGRAPFHWLYHKCGFCGSYNTRVIQVPTIDSDCPI